MQISLAQAVALRNILARKIQELINERSQVAIISVPKGEQFERPNKTIESLTEEINEVRSHFRQLDVAMATANLNHTIHWDDQDITIMEAIELAKQMRGELQELKRFGSRKKQEYSSHYGEVVMVEHALYDPAEYQEKAKKLERKVNRLSYLIEAENHQVNFDFPPATIYLGE
ncbi:MULTISPECIES: hypothetical protein [unclassified Thermoactinomyces]|jgi:hypothetical protein|nr:MULTISPECIES: hypothetical protein [unclassified Thermoactinomyces]MBH8599424.1 hypothetical protein [Thermoactinomyces sp. CICC 10523]MBH8605207.1 hypothetical protein [Thermoactinomyces sp. CICC 10522]